MGVLTESDMHSLCEQVVKDTDYHADDIQIDLTIQGYVSYIEISGEVCYKGKCARTIEESLKNLQKKIKPNAF